MGFRVADRRTVLGNVGRMFYAWVVEYLRIARTLRSHGPCRDLFVIYFPRIDMFRSKIKRVRLP